MSPGRRDEFCRPCDTIPHSLISTGGHSSVRWHSRVSVNRIKVDSSVVCFCDWSRDLVIRYNKIAFNLPEDEMALRAISYVVCLGPHAKGPSPAPYIIFFLTYSFDHPWTYQSLVDSQLDAALWSFTVSELRFCPHFIKEYRNCYFFTISFCYSFSYFTFSIHLPNLFFLFPLFVSFKRLHRDEDIVWPVEIKIYVLCSWKNIFITIQTDS